MRNLHLPYVKMPEELTGLLKMNLSVVTSPSQIFDGVRMNFALMRVLETTFQEFDDGRGVEKVMIGLGWPNFRERWGSLYIYKAIHGNYPAKTNMELVEEIKKVEAKYDEFALHGYSRLFLLGLYLKLANLELQNLHDNQYIELKISDHVKNALKLSQGRSEKIDWLILITMHLTAALGEKALLSALISGKKFMDIYGLLSRETREEMNQNLLAYSASIYEPDFFLYEKV